MIDRRLVICAVLSLLAHFALARGLEHLPKHETNQPPQKVEVRIIEPPPPPPPEPPKPEEPKPEIPHEIPKAHPFKAPTVAPVAKDTPPPDQPAFQTDTTEEPVYGVTMSSTSTVGTGPAMPIGNTTKVEPGPGSAKAVKPLAEPVAAAEATKLPLPQGQCFGKYTDEAKAAGIEGDVVLDLIVGEDGRVREVQVQHGLPQGLTEAAIAALKACRFSPGERDGKPVPVRVRGFKIHFVLDSAGP